ncbi:hypothetical protein BVX93_02300, partial [bacterium B13(2017)]
PEPCDSKIYKLRIDFSNVHEDIKIKSIFKDFEHYLSIFSSPLWHDSRQCHWKELEDNYFAGRLPWLPIKLYCKIISNKKNNLSIFWDIECLKEVHLEKVHLVFPLESSFFNGNNDKSDIFYTSTIDKPLILKSENKNIQIDGRTLQKNFILTIEKLKEIDYILNFVWLCNPIKFLPGNYSLGSVNLER